jgi:hypothetical protein
LGLSFHMLFIIVLGNNPERLIVVFIGFYTIYS